MRNFSHRKVVFIFNHCKNPYISNNNNICKNYIKNATSIIIENKFDFNMNNANNKIVKKMNLKKTYLWRFAGFRLPGKQLLLFSEPRGIIVPKTTDFS